MQFGFSNITCTHSFLRGSRIAYVDSKFQPFTTIRHNECELLLPESATAKSCSKCEAYRKMLHAMASRYHKQQKVCHNKTSPQSHTNYRFLYRLLKKPKGSIACTMPFMLQKNRFRNSRQRLLKSVREVPRK